MPLRFVEVDDSGPGEVASPTAIKEALPGIMENFRSVFLESGSHIPIVFANKEGCIEIFGLFDLDNDGKREFAKNIREWAKEGKLLEFCMICESWLNKGVAAVLHNVIHGTIGGSIGCKEGLTVNYTSPSEQLLRVAMIHRDPLVLDEWEDLPATDIDGLFGNLWGVRDGKCPRN